MTTKEASIKFKLDMKEVQQRVRDQMITVTHDGRKIVIPDDTKMIPSKKEIQSFLFQILKFKNNPSITVSRVLCPDETSLSIVMEYLYQHGFIGEYRFNSDIQQLFQDISLTESGFTFLFGERAVKVLGESTSIPINLSGDLVISSFHIF